MIAATSSLSIMDISSCNAGLYYHFQQNIFVGALMSRHFLYIGFIIVFPMIWVYSYKYIVLGAPPTGARTFHISRRGNRYASTISDRKRILRTV